MKVDAENYWEVFPNPIVLDKDDLLEVLDQIDPVSYNEDERETFGDWFRLVPEKVRDEAALERPHKVMVAEVISFLDTKAVYARTIARNAEMRHLRREIMGLQRENERLRGVIARKAAWEQMREETKDAGSVD